MRRILLFIGLGLGLVSAQSQTTFDFESGVSGFNSKTITQLVSGQTLELVATSENIVASTDVTTPINNTESASVEGASLGETSIVVSVTSGDLFDFESIVIREASSSPLTLTLTSSKGTTDLAFSADQEQVWNVAGSGDASFFQNIENVTITGSANYLIDFDDVVLNNFIAPNTDPTVDTNTGLTLNEGTTAGITTSELSSSDSEEGASSLTFTVQASGTVQNGVLFLDGDGDNVWDGGAPDTDLSGSGSTFTQQDIADGDILYEHDGSETTADDFDFIVDDGAGGSTSNATFSITINAVNDIPAFANLDGNPTFVEDATAVVLDANVTIADPELDAADDYNGASLTIERTGAGVAEDDFGFVDGGGITLGTNELIKNAQSIAGFNVSSGTLTVLFTNANGETPIATDVDLVLQQITYQNTSNNPPASVTLDWTFNDGTDPSTGTNQTVVDITSTNDAPVFTIGNNITLAQDAAGVQTYNGFITGIDDGDGTSQSLTFNVADDNNGLFSAGPAIDASGNLTFTLDGSVWGQATVTVSLSDDGTPNETSADQEFEIYVTPTGIVINEAEPDDSGTVGDFIEIYDGGAGTTALDGLVLVLYNGAGQEVISDDDLDTYSTDANGYFVIGDAGVANVAATWTRDIQNGPDAIALYVGNASDFVASDPVTTDGLVDVLVYGTGASADLTALETAFSVSSYDEDENGNSGTESLSRVPDGASTFIARTPTPGVANNAIPTSSSFNTFTSITTVTTFSVADFNYSDGDGDGFESIEVSNLDVTDGALFLDDGASPNDGIQDGDEPSIANSETITVAQIPDLTYVGATAVDTESFDFTVNDGFENSSSYTASLYTVENALDFDGSDDNVSGSEYGLTYTVLSIEMWVKANSTKTTTSMIYQEGATGIKINQFTQGKVFVFFDGSSAGNSAADESITDILDDGWHHIAATNDGTTTRLYIDGVLENEYAEAISNATTALNIGSNNGSSEYFQGAIDELRVWDDVRLASEIRTNAASRLTGSESNLVAYYNFNNGIASGNNTGLMSLSDAVSGFDGTLNNFDVTGGTGGGATSNWVASAAFGAAAPEIRVTDGSINEIVDGGTFTFGAFNVRDGATESETFTIHNDGLADLTITGSGDIAVSNTAFTVDQTGLTFPLVLTPGTNATFDIDWTAVAETVVSESETLTINSDDTDEAVFDYAVTGYVVENGLDFDGTDDYVSVGNQTGISFENTDAFTIEFWANTTSTNQQTIIDKYASEGYIVQLQSGGFYRLYLAGGANQMSAQTTIAVGTSEWHHIALTYDGSNSQGGLKIFIDGAEVPVNLSGAASLPGTMITTEGLDIGYQSAGAGQQYFEGSLDELMIWSEERTPAQIRANAASRFGNPSGEATLELYYDFNHGIPSGDNSGLTTLTDLSSNGYDGTLTNFDVDGSNTSGTVSNWIASDAFASTAATTPNIVVYQGSVAYPSGGTAYGFTDTGYGATRDIVFTVTNEGLADLDLDGVLAVDDATNYAFVTPYTPTETVGPGLTQDFTVRFQPQTVGTFPASVTIPNDDPDGDYDLNITGDGVDLTPPVFQNSTPAISAVTTVGFTIETDIDEDGVVYYVVVPANATAPDLMEIQAGQESGGGAADAAGNFDVSTETDNIYDFVVTGLSTLTTYDVYVFAEDDETTPNEQASATLIEDVTTAGNNSTLAAVASSESEFFNSGDYDADGSGSSFDNTNSVQVLQFTITDETGDGLPTIIDDFDITISSSTDPTQVKAIGLSTDGGTSFITETVVSSATETLTVSGGLTVADNTVTTVSVFVSYDASPAEEQYQFTVSDYTQPADGTSVISTASVASSVSGDENTVDNTPPTVVNLEIFDTDNNGFIDAIDIIFDEPIDTDDSSLPTIADIGTLKLPDNSDVVTTNSTPSISDPAFGSSTVSVTGIDVLDHISELENTANGSTSIDGLTGRWVDRAGNAIEASGDDSEGVIDSALPVLISSQPTDNSLSFSPSADFEFEFSEDIAIGASGTRTVTVNEITGGPTLHEIIDISGETPTGATLTLTPSVALTLTNEYAIQISADAIDDLTGNSYSGINNNDDLDFIVNNTAPEFDCGHTYAVGSEDTDGNLSPSSCNTDATEIQSTVNTQTGAATVLYFNLLNGSDGHENVSEVIVRNENSLDWTKVIEGAQIINHLGAVNTASPTIDADKITFPMGTGNGEVGDLVGNDDASYGLEYGIRIWLKTDMTTLNNTIDGELMSFSVNHGDMVKVDKVLNAAGTAFETNTATLISNSVTIVVDPTHYGFEEQPTDTEARQVMSPAVTVEAQDVNGNRDEDYAGTEILTIGTSGNNLDGTPTTTGAFVAGLATVDDILFTVETGNTGITLNVVDNANDVLNVANTSDAFTITADVTDPVVTAGAISLTSTGTGNGGYYIVGDQVDAEWNNNTDGNVDIASVIFDFSEFGGGDVAGTESAGVWSASYTVAAGSIENTNRNVFVEATDDATTPNTNAPVEGTDNVSVDNQKPSVNTYDPANLANSVTTDADLILTFDEDVVASFGEIDIVDQTNGTQTQTFVANNTSYVNVSNNVVTITAPNAFVGNNDYYVLIDATAFTDSEGNPYDGIAVSSTWGFQTAADLEAPNLTLSYTLSGGGDENLTNSSDIVIGVEWNEEVSNFDKNDISISASGVTYSFAFRQTGTKNYEIGLSSITGDGDLDFEVVDNGAFPATKIQDLSGNAFDDAANADEQTITIDNTDPVLTLPSVSTNDATPAINGTVDENIAVTVRVNGVTDYTGTSNSVNGTIYDWELPDDIVSTLTEGNVPLLAFATDDAGNLGQIASTIKIDLTKPELLSGYYYDTNGDGNIDRININTTEQINVGTIDASDFIIDGGNGTATLNGSTTAQTIRLDISGVSGTGLVDVDYTPAGTGILDLVGNEMDPQTSIGEIDVAKPIILQAYYYDNNQDGTIEEIVVEFSEDMSFSSALSSEFTLDPSGAAINPTIVSHNDRSNPLDLESTDEYITLGVSISGTSTQTSLADLDFTASSFRDLNSQLAVTQSSITKVDRADPVIINVTSSSTNSTGLATAYEAGSVIPITVEFSEDITVGGTGTPTFGMNASVTSTANFLSQAANLDSLNFDYTVAVDDESNDLDYDDGESVTLNGRTLQDWTGNDALLTLPTAGASGSLGFNKDLIIDGIAPQILNAYMYDHDDDGTLDEVVVEFDEGMDYATVASTDFNINSSTVGHTLINSASAVNSEDAADDDEFVTFTVNIASSSVVPVTYTQGTIKDLAGNLSPTDTDITEVDEALPVFLNAYYYDTDGSGSIDEIVLEFSEEIDESTITTANYALTGGSISSLSTFGSGNIDNGQDLSDADEFATFEVSLTGTATANLSYTKGTTADVSGNLAETFGPINAVDEAIPIFLNAYQYDLAISGVGGADGDIDEIVIQLSEAIDISTFETSDFTLGSGTITAFYNHVSNSADIDNSLDVDDNDSYYTLEVSTTTTADVTVDYEQSSAVDLADAAGNLVVDASLTTVDEALPVFLNAYYYDTDGNGNIDEITIQFSEPVVETTVESNDFTLTNGSVTSTATHGGSGGIANSLDIDDDDSYVTLEVSLTGTATTNLAYNRTFGGASATQDDVGNEAGNNSIITTTDEALPVFLNAYYYDTDDSGNIDEIVLEFSEEIDETTIVAGEYSLAGGGAVSSVSTVANAGVIDNSLDASDTDEYATLEVALSGTATAQLGYTAGSTQDLVANNANSNADITRVDEAFPIFLNAYQYDLSAGAGADGTIDEIVVQLSEPINIATVQASDFTLGSGTVSAFYRHSTGAANIDNSLDANDTDAYYTLEVSTNTTAAVSVSYAQSSVTDLADSEGNLIANTSINTTDLAIPVFINAHYFDTDDNGDIDEVVLEFSEEINESTVAFGDYTLSGGSVDASSTVASTNVDNSLDANDSDKYATLEVTLTGTATNTLGYTQGTTADMVGNLAATLASIDEVDEATPIFLNAYQYDLSAGAGADGTIDEIVVQLSEPINIATVQASDFTLGSGTVSAFYRHSTGAANIDNSLDANDTDAYYTLEVSTNTTAAVSVSYAQSSVTDISDATGNLAVNGSVNTVDLAAPVALTAFQYDQSANGDIDEIVISFSEAVDPSDGENADFTVASTQLNGTNGQVVNAGTASNSKDVNDTDEFLTLSVTDAIVTGTATVQVGYNGAGGATSQIQDNAASPNNAVDVASITQDDQAVPRVINVSSSDTDGLYQNGESLNIQVIYSEAVTVTTTGGTPTIRLETGSTDQTVNYDNNTVANTLEFTYTIQVGDESADLDYQSTSALTLNGGTILDQSANANSANNTLFAPGGGSLGEGSLFVNKDLEVDGVLPEILKAWQYDTDGNGTIDEIVIELSEEVDETTAAIGDFGISSGTITQISTNSGSDDVQNSKDANDSDEFVTLEVNITGTSTVSVSYTQGSLADIAGNLTPSDVSITVDDQAAPVITNVTSSVANTAYNENDVIPIQVTFSEFVNVTGTPVLTLATTGITDQDVNFSSGSGSATLTFEYTVVDGDESTDLAYLSTTALGITGAAIQDQSANTNDAVVTLPALGATGSLNLNKNIVIDTQEPGIDVLTISSDNATTTLAKGIDPNLTGDTADEVTITMDFDDELQSAPTVQVRSGGSFVTDQPTVNVISAPLGQYTATFTVDRSDADGRVSFTINYTDKAGNSGVQLDTTDISSGTTITVDNTSPTVDFSVTDSNNPNSDNPFNITADFNETVVGLVVGDFASSDGTLTNLLNPSGNQYTFDVTPTADQTSTITVEMIDEGVTDQTGNTIVRTTFDVDFDDQAPNILSNVTDSVVVYGQDLTVTLNIDEVGELYYALVPNGTSATAAEVKAQTVTGATSEGILSYSVANIDQVLELSLDDPRTDYDLLLVSEDKVNPTPFNLSGVTTIDIKSGGVVVNNTDLDDFCLEGEFYTLDDITITETIATDFVSSTANRTLRLVLPDVSGDGIADFEFNTDTGGETISVAGGDLASPSLIFTSSSILTITYQVPTVANLDVMTISGLEIKATGSTTSNATIERSGGNGNIYLANDGDDVDFATLNTVAPYAAPSTPATEPSAGFTTPYLYEISSEVLEDDMGDGVTVYEKGDVVTTLTPFRAGLPSTGDVLTIYSDAALTTQEATYTATTNEDTYSPTLADLGLDDTDVGVNTFYITSTDGLSCESEATKYSVAIIRVENSQGKTGYAVSDGTGTTLKYSFPTGHTRLNIGNGLTGYNTDNDFTSPVEDGSSVRFIPSAAGQGTHVVTYQLTNSTSNVTANYGIEFLIIESDKVLSTTGNQAIDYCQYDDAVTLNMVSPTGIDYKDDPDGDELSTPDFKTVRVFLYDSDEEQVADRRGSEVTSDVFSSFPTKVADQPNDTTGWVFEPGGVDSQLTGSVYSQELLFVYVISEDGDDSEETELSQQVITIYREPTVTITNMNEYYCNDDGDFDITSQIVSATGTETLTLAGYTIYKGTVSGTDTTYAVYGENSGVRTSASFDPADPDNDGTAYPDEEEFGLYRIEYTSPNRTNAECSTTITYDFEILEIPALPSLVTDDFDGHSDGDEGSYTIEYCAGETVSSLTMDLSSYTAADSIKINWYTDANLTSSIAASNISGANFEVLNLASAFFGGNNQPTGRQNVTFYYTITDNINVDGGGYTGCESEAKTISLQVYPIPGQPVAESLVSSSTTNTFNSKDVTGEYFYEYCIADGETASLETVDLDETLNTEDASESFFVLYDEDANEMVRFQDPDTLTDAVIKDIFSYGATDSTSLVFYVSQKNFDNNYPSGTSEFDGCEGETRKFTIDINAIPDTPASADFNGYDNEGVVEYYLCSGDNLENILTPQVEGAKYNWYQDDSGSPSSSVISVSSFNDNFVRQSELTAVGFTNSVSTETTFTYWVTQTVEANTASGFKGCESDTLRVNITVFPDPSTPIIDADGQTGLSSYEASFCEGSVDFSYDIVGRQDNSEDVTFNIYSFNNGNISTSPVYTINDGDGQITITQTELRLAQAEQGVYEFRVAQVNTTVTPDGAIVFEGCETEVAEMTPLTFYIYDVPGAPIIGTDPTGGSNDFIYYNQGDVIEDITVAGESNSVIYRWYNASTTELILEDTIAIGSSSASASQLGISGPGVYEFTVNQTADFGQGVIGFQGCTGASESFTVTVFELPSAPITTDPAPQCNEQLTPTSTRVAYSGVATSSDSETRFYFYDDTQSEQQNILSQNPEIETFLTVSGVDANYRNTQANIDTTIYIQQVTNVIPGEFDGSPSELSEVSIVVAPKPVVGDYGPENRFQIIEACSNALVTLDVKLVNVLVDDATFDWSAGNTETLNEPINPVSSTKLNDYEMRFEFDPAGLGAGDKYFEVEITDTNRPTGLNGCTETAFMNFEIGTSPVPKVRWEGITEGRNTTLVFGDDNTSQSANYWVDSIYVEIPDIGYVNGQFFGKPSGAIDRNNLWVIDSAIFDNSGVYNIEVTYFSGSACIGTLTRSITILDHFVVTDNIAFGFDGADLGEWFAEYTNGFTSLDALSWEIGTSNFDDQPRDGNYWVTGDNSQYGALGSSWVYSPSFDLSGMSNPTIGFDHARDLNFTDGVVFQQSLDDGRTWQTVGSFSNGLGSGKNWYTTEAVNGAPGGTSSNPSAFAWSRQESWATTAHRMDSLYTQVRFRFALGNTGGTKVDTDGTPQDGFAFDDFSIYNKDKFILIEQFSNLGNSSSLESDTAVINIVRDELSSDAILLTYISGDNDLTFRNDSDPSSRASYYAIENAPQSILSGRVPGEEDEELDFRGEIKGWNKNYYSSVALDEALFQIGDMTFGDDPGVIDLSASFTYTGGITLPAETELSFRFAVVEKQINDPDIVALNGGVAPRNVLRKMLPSSGGLTYKGRVTSNQEVFFNGTSEVSLSWGISEIYDASELMVIAFVQVDNLPPSFIKSNPSFSNRLILQAKAMDVDGKIVPEVTGVEKIPGIDQFEIYPNPANKSFKVQLESSPGSEMNWVVYDQVGRRVVVGAVKPGELEIEVDSRELPSGVYMIHFFNSEEKWLPKRLIILH